jgi:hypothetical protein
LLQQSGRDARAPRKRWLCFADREGKRRSPAVLPGSRGIERPDGTLSARQGAAFVAIHGGALLGEFGEARGWDGTRGGDRDAARLIARRHFRDIADVDRFSSSNDL